MVSEQHRFTDMYVRHVDDVRRFVVRRVETDVVDDVVSSVFMTAWRRFNELTSTDSLLPWLYTTAGHAIANERRAQGRRKSLVEQVGSMNPRVDRADHVGASADLMALAEAFDDLAPGDQEVLRLVAWEDMPIAEAARVLGVTRAALSMRLSRARRRLAARWRSVDVDEHENHHDDRPVEMVRDATEGDR